MFESLHSISKTGIRSVYLSELERHASSVAGSGVVVHYFGEFSHSMINGLSESIEDLMISNGDSKTSIKRVFSMLIQGFQNIRAHGERDTEGVQSAFVVIAREKDVYRISLGNLILQKEKETIEHYFSRINPMSDSQLKDLYLDILNNGFFTRRGGAGLGFLIMRMKSEHPLGYSFQNIDDRLCFFRVEITINRSL